MTWLILHNSGAHPKQHDCVTYLSVRSSGARIHFGYKLQIFPIADDAKKRHEKGRPDRPRTGDETDDDDKQGADNPHSHGS